MRLLVLSILVLPGCSSVDPESLFDRGAYDVGYRVIDVTYDIPGSDDDRTVPLHVWYPAESGSSEDAATYAVAGIVTVRSTGALAGPQPVDESDLPLVVYSHGSGGEGLLAYPYGEHMASHGWVVASADHLGNTARDYLDESGDPFARILVNRPLDITASLDALDGDLGGDPLGGLADTDNVLVFGHSFGGYTVLASGGAMVDTTELVEANCDGDGEWDGSCAILDDAEVAAAFSTGFRDDRVVAIVPQAPGFIPNFVEGTLSDLPIPTMLQSGRLDQTTLEETQAAPAWAELDHPGDVRVDLPTGAHYSFITICDDLTDAVINLFRPDAFDDGCDEERFIDTSEAVPALGAYLDAFARQHVQQEKGWDDVILGDPLHPDMIVTTHDD